MVREKYFADQECWKENRGRNVIPTGIFHFNGVFHASFGEKRNHSATHEQDHSQYQVEARMIAQSNTLVNQACNAQVEQQVRCRQ